MCLEDFGKLLLANGLVAFVVTLLDGFAATYSALVLANLIVEVEVVDKVGHLIIQLTTPLEFADQLLPRPLRDWVNLLETIVLCVFLEVKNFALRVIFNLELLTRGNLHLFRRSRGHNRDLTLLGYLYITNDRSLGHLMVNVLAQAGGGESCAQMFQLAAVRELGS